MEEGGLGDFDLSIDSMSPVAFSEPAASPNHAGKRCFFCNLVFPSVNMFYKHKLRCQKSSSNVAYCWSCRRGFAFKSLLLNHRCSRSYRRKLSNKRQLLKNLAEAKGLIANQEKKPPETTNSVPSPPSLNSVEDTQVVVEDTQVIVCPKCKDKFSSAKYFQYHIDHNLCLPEISICKICSREFDDLEEMEFHEQRCAKKQKLMDSLKKKYEQNNNKVPETKEKRLFTCRSCKESFSSPQLLKTHLETNPRCIRIHNLKIKLRCFWERGGDLSESARKSFPNFRARKSGFSSKSSNSYEIPENQEKYSWESTSNTSTDSYKSSIIGAARKTFRGASQTSEPGSFCDVCYRYFSSAGALRVHMEKHYDRREKVVTNKCPECIKTFPDFSSLRAHQEANDHWGKATKSMSSKCSCPYCSKTFMHPQSRNVHVKTHSDEYPGEVEEFLLETTCSFCSQVFATEVLKIQHIKLTHGSPPIYEDESKDEIAKEEPNVSKIFQSHKFVGYSNKNVLVNVTPTLEKQLKQNPNQCPICLKEYSTSFIRNRHFRTHTLDQALECKFCPTKFPRSDRLMHHMQQEHNDYLAYECCLCKLRFTTRMRALQHGNKAHPNMLPKTLIKVRQVNLNPFHKRQSKFPSSINEAVIPEEEFYCDVCELSFLKLCGLQRHRQSKLHRDLLEKSNPEKMKPSFKLPENKLEQRPPLSTTPPFIDYSKKFKCSSCSLDFDSVNDFVPHRLSHFSMQSYGEKINELNPYNCEICGKVMDNHQRIQLHLFWHLQDVQLQAGSKNAIKSNAISSKDSADLGGQAVAKKSINKSLNKAPQELIIAGVKKPLYTCDACHISFTTKQHYTLHVQRYCRLKKQENDKESNDSDKGSVTAGFCKICGCIFSSSSLYEEHKTLFCNKSNFVPLNDIPAALYTEMVKSLMQLDTMVAGCVRCNLAFDSMNALSEHSTQHVTVEGEATPAASENDLPAEDKPADICIESDEMDGTLKIVQDEGTGMFENAHSDLNSESEQDGAVPKDSNDTADDKSGDAIGSLRDNFSRLLFVLVSDQELMEQLGYGKAIIDEVLVNVLNQMGLVPVPEDEVCTALDRFRRNIRILLDVCIKDQIMELIADGEASIDHIVSAALRMFGVEDSPSDSTIE